MARLDRAPIKATEIRPWPSTWIIMDPWSKMYLKSVEGGSGLRVQWSKDIKEALHLAGNDAMFLAPLMGDSDMPVHIVQCPEED